MKPYIQPFEKRLALDELRALTKTEPRPHDTSGRSVFYCVQPPSDITHLLNRLSYWESIEGNEGTRLTDQVRIEFQNRTKRISSLNNDLVSPSRRSLRYGPHGIHEYKGKFFPQLARALINIADLPPHALVADPMLGSGTVAIEALTSGHPFLGMDINPLSVYLSRTKCAIISESPQDLSNAANCLRWNLHALQQSSNRLSSPTRDDAYIRQWFTKEALRDLDHIIFCIALAPPGPIQDLFRILVSNVLRRASLQDPHDLRIRRRKHEPPENVMALFSDELNSAVQRLVPFLEIMQGRTLPMSVISCADATSATNSWRSVVGKINLIVTSPPYAMALPYLDTDRLSLTFLELWDRRERRDIEQKMVGSREITPSQRLRLWQNYCVYRQQLPAPISSFVDAIEQRHRVSNGGFRRQNLAPLLSRYFFSMKSALREMHALLSHHGIAYVIIGNNHTMVNGERVEISTGEFLVDLAESVGFHFRESVPMEMLTARGIHSRNAINSEYILCFDKR